MRLLAVATALALLLAGCLGSSQNPDVQTQTAPPVAVLGLAVHKGGAALPAAAPADVVGAVPKLVEKLLGVNGAEPNIGVTASGAIFVSAFDFVMRSTDNGDTWESVHEFGDIHPPPPLPNDPIRDSDPMLWVDKDTDRVFSPVMWPVLVCSSGAYSDDDGASWTGTPVACGYPPPMDHQKYATGRYASGGPLQPTPAYPNVVYYCYNQIIATQCGVSLDGGLTFPLTRTAASGAECGGINGHPKARDTDGAVFVPLGINCGQPKVAVSKDNGLTWAVKSIDAGDLGQEELDPAVAVSPAGTLYYMWRAAKDHRMYMVSSTDDFSTHSAPTLVSPPEVRSTRFAALVAGDEGRVAFAYLGTRDTDKGAGDAPDETRWHLFVTYTFDALAEEPTFVTTQVTAPEDPVQVGYMWEGGGGDPGRNLLDFIDMVVDKEGKVYVAFADGCVEECVTKGQDAKPGDSRARAAAVAVMETGPLLFAEPHAEWGTTSAGFVAATPAGLR